MVLIEQIANRRGLRVEQRKAFSSTCCAASSHSVFCNRKGNGWRLIADLVTMVMCRLLSFMRGLNGLEAPFKMLACEEVAKHVLTACL